MKHSISSLIVALGISLAGFFLYLGIHEFATKDRIVTVKGLAEREVSADYVVWPIQFGITGNDLQALYRQLQDNKNIGKQFLLERGFKDEEITFGTISVADTRDSYYDHRPDYRYKLSSSIIVSTPDVQRVIDNHGCESELISKGLVFTTNSWSIDYQYNGLSQIKPDMVQEATKNAHAVAEKFANDASCRLGSIQWASQGQFTIDADSDRPWMKHIRVVTTVNYYLK